MTPPGKRARTSSTTPRESNDTTGSIHVQNAALQGFLDELDTIESTKPVDSMPVLMSAASHLVQVKSSQREMLELLDTAIDDRDRKRAELQRKNILLQNLLYERNHLQNELDSCKDFPAPHLERMCRDELGDEDPVASESIANIVNLFLCGNAEKSIYDPENHKSILTKLHRELNSRGSLLRDLEKAQSSLTKRKLVAEKEEIFLRDIPKKLEMIEKCSIPLQEFFLSSATDNTLKFTGPERKKRLELAKSLSSPLYALFVQFQAHIDDQDAGSETATLEVVSKTDIGNFSSEIAPNPTVVHLHFIIPDIHLKDSPNAKKKRVTIEFAFFQGISRVTALAFGGGDKINAKTLLTNLFPGDSGLWIGQSDDSTRVTGKPFHWCNYLAGLILPSPPSAHAVNLSTKAVVFAIRKRVRANATLTQQLITFERRKPIAHPLLRDKLNVSDCSAKLVSWTAVDDCSVSTDESATYVATIKNGSRILAARVIVSWSKYPSVRPSWSLCEGNEAWAANHGSVSKLHEETNPLYSNPVGHMESLINDDYLNECQDPGSFDWIISHQLIKLIRLWDVGEAVGLGIEGTTRDGARLIKGRNRVSIT